LQSPPALVGKRRRLGRLEQLGEYFVLEGHEVKVLELENLVLGGVGVSLETAALQM
jgi:hypothetical protein